MYQMDGQMPWNIQYIYFRLPLVSDMIHFDELLERDVALCCVRKLH